MPIRGEASVQLAGGGTLRLAVNFATLAKAAAATKIPAQDIFAVLAVDDGRQLLAMLGLLEFALEKHHGGQYSADDVGELMLSDGAAIGVALGAAISGAFGEEEAGADAPPNPRKARPEAGPRPSPGRTARRPGTGAGSRARGRRPG